MIGGWIYRRRSPGWLTRTAPRPALDLDNGDGAAFEITLGTRSGASASGEKIAVDCGRISEFDG
jgi:hypothetical protein